MKLTKYLLISALMMAIFQSQLTTTRADPLPDLALTFKPYALTEADIALIHDGVRELLRDPESARFGTILASISSKGIIYSCGWVNAKNGYGGYAGKKPFIVYLKNGKAIADSLVTSDSEVLSTVEWCSKYGLDLKAEERRFYHFLKRPLSAI